MPTAILVRTCAASAPTRRYLPNRGDDGYGLSAATVERLAARGTRLLVTADCGTRRWTRSPPRDPGLEVVVTDHHEPRAAARCRERPIVHPARRCGYPFRDLCAGRRRFKVAGALPAPRATMREDRLPSDHELVALATVSDCVPLRRREPLLARRGLSALEWAEKVAARAPARVKSPRPRRREDVGFTLGPRINAAGRLGPRERGARVAAHGRVDDGARGSAPSAPAVVVGDHDVKLRDARGQPS